MPFKGLLENDIKLVFQFILGLPLIFINLIWILIKCYIIMRLEYLFVLIGNNRFSNWLSNGIYPVLESLICYIDGKINSYYNWLDGIICEITSSFLNVVSNRTYTIIATIIILIFII